MKKLHFETIGYNGSQYAQITKLSAAISIAVEAGYSVHDIYKLYKQCDRGEITDDQFWKSVFSRIVTGMCTVGFSLLGNAVGFAFGGPLGFFVGGMLGNLFGQKLGKFLGDRLYMTRNEIKDYKEKNIPHSPKSEYTLGQLLFAAGATAVGGILGGSVGAAGAAGMALHFTNKK